MPQPRRLSIPAVLLSLLLAAGAATGQTDAVAPAEIDAQVKRVEAALNRLQLEQQSVHQEFQMVQELRRSVLQERYQSSLVYTPPATPPNYDDEVREREDRDARLDQYSAELDRLYDRYRALEQQKQPLLEELARLATQRP